ncbi:hypothetical protein SELMODRAFT_419813 [Selaginella moellendorffii]|uniref:Uncharacterized protein n=1 Tax=Selaginella moellendorffii TaxID=88036 RepID=D8SAM5_SELML|nr:hypothetical protein SELMODRAFT_419813 [Selaginella moellendorffii]
MVKTVAVCGIETPEDLLIDGLGHECILANTDFQGLFMLGHLSDTARHEISSLTPHYGHVDVVAAARELAFKLDSPSFSNYDSAFQNLHTYGRYSILPCIDAVIAYIFEDNST